MLTPSKDTMFACLHVQDTPTIRKSALSLDFPRRNRRDERLIPCMAPQRAPHILFPIRTGKSIKNKPNQTKKSCKGSKK